MSLTAYTSRLITALAVLTLSLVFAQASAPAPVRGGSLVVAINDEPALLDPTFTPAAETQRMMYGNVLEGLVGFSEGGGISPVLATAMPKISDAGLSYTFTLRKNVSFHDGSAFTSADVKHAFDQARDATSGRVNPQYFTDIAAINTLDAYTVQFKLKKVNGEFIFNLARAESVIEPSGADPASLKTHPIGTGPFKFDAWTRGVSVKLTRNSKYWQPSLPYLDSVTFRFMSGDTATQVAALRAGDVDVIGYNLPAEQAAALRSDKNFKVINGNSTGEIVIGLNNARKPFSDLRVRQAFNYAINKREIVDGAFFGYGKPIGSMNSEGERYFVDLSGYYAYNPDKAKALLKAAGYANGLSVTFAVTNEFPIERKTAEVYVAQLAKVGVKAQIELIPFATWLTRVFTNHDYDMTIIGHAEPFDMDRFAEPNYYFGYNSKEYQQLNAEAIASVSEVKRTALYGRMQRLLAHDAAAVFAFTAPYLAATRANVYGWWKNQPTPALVCSTVFKTR